MAITADFETGVDTSTITTGDTGSANAWNGVTIGTGNSVTYDDDHVHGGTLAGKVHTPTSGNAYLTWTTAFGTQSDHYGRLYIYSTVLGSSALPLINFLSGGQLCCRLLKDGTAHLALADSGFTTRATSTLTISIDTWYRIEWHVTHGTGAGSLMEVKVFAGANVEGTTPDETISMANFNLRASSNEVRFGLTNQGTYWLDDIIGAATSYPGPSVAVATYTPRVVVF